MPRSLADALNTAGSPPARSERGDSAVPPPGRRGRKAVTVYLDPAAHRQLPAAGAGAGPVRSGLGHGSDRRFVREARKSAACPLKQRCMLSWCHDVVTA